jgi:hypothetical protein
LTASGVTDPLPPDKLGAEAPAGIDFNISWIVATSESEVAKYFSDTEPVIAESGSDDEALLTINVTPTGTALAATGARKETIRLDRVTKMAFFMALSYAF